MPASSLAPVYPGAKLTVSVPARRFPAASSMSLRMAARSVLVLAAMALVNVVVAASPCARVTLMVNSTVSPWTYAWSPSVSILESAACGEVMVGVKMSDTHIAELSQSLQKAHGLAKLSLHLTSAYGIAWQNPSMDSFLRALKALPIEDFTLWASMRERWPSDAVSRILIALPRLTALTLRLENTRQTDASVSTWATALPASLESLDIDLQNNYYMSNTSVDALLAGTETLPLLRHFDVRGVERLRPAAWATSGKAAWVLKPGGCATTAEVVLSSGHDQASNALDDISPGMHSSSGATGIEYVGGIAVCALLYLVLTLPVVNKCIEAHRLLLAPSKGLRGAFSGEGHSVMPRSSTKFREQCNVSAAESRPKISSDAQWFWV